jgi:hypothetical protein
MLVPRHSISIFVKILNELFSEPDAWHQAKDSLGNERALVMHREFSPAFVALAPDLRRRDSSRRLLMFDEFASKCRESLDAARKSG